MKNSNATSINRRDWIGSATASAALMGSTAFGIEPIPRSAPARFQFSLAAYSYRDLLTGDTPAMSLFDFVDDCANFGLDGTELTSYYFEQPVSDDYLRKLKRHCFLHGIDISGTAVRCDFGVPPGPQRDAERAQMKYWIDRAAVLGAPVIRIFAGHQPDGQSAKQTHTLIVDGIQESCDYAARHGIHLALENHGGPTATPAGLLAIVQDVDSPWFGVNLDTGNFHSTHVYDELAETAPFAINVQIKVVVSDPDGKKTPADFRRLAKILRASNYRGYIVLEYEENADPRAECRRYVGELREAFA